MGDQGREEANSALRLSLGFARAFIDSMPSIFVAKIDFDLT